MGFAVPGFPDGDSVAKFALLLCHHARVGVFGFGKRDSDSDDAQGEGEAWGMAPAHPRFAAHFTHPMYNDPADDWAPFGSDEAADTLAEWEERRDELTPTSRPRDMYDSEEEWQESVAEIGTSPLDADDEATWVVARAFTLLRLTGQIDDEGKAVVLRGLDRLPQETGNAEEYLQQKRDVEAWRNDPS